MRFVVDLSIPAVPRVAKPTEGDPAMREPSCSARRRLTYVSMAILVCLVAATVPVALANPVPGAGLMVNVGVDPEILTRCEDVVQHTTDTGQLIFDAYYYPVAYIEWGLGIESVTATFTWPAEWEFVAAYEPLGDGSGHLQPYGEGYRLEWTFHDCPMLYPDSPLLFIGRFVMNVTGLGEFEASVESAVSCYPGGGVIEPAAGSARAGVECSYCDQPCTLSMPSWTEFSPTELAIEASQGEDASGSFTVTVNDMNPPETITFESDAGWLEFAWQWINYWQIDLDVTAHTAGLDPGVHSARVRAVTEDCTGCAWVELTVLPSAQSIEEEPADEGITWGQVKELFR